MILDPNHPGFDHLADEDRKAIEATVGWFEERGKVALKDADREHRWYSDYLAFQAQEGIFSRFLTPARDGGGDPQRRWDTQRICALSEVSAFYGLSYWYTWQVTILGLGPIFQSDNEGRGREPHGCSRAARSSPSASPSGPTAPTSTRPTWS